MTPALFRLTIFNFAGACVVTWAWFSGHIARLTAADGSHMTLIIAAVFVYGVATTFWWARKVSYVAANGGSVKRLWKPRFLISTAHLYDIMSALFILGIIGNAIGFLSAFGGIDTSSLTTPEGMRAAGAQLLSGSGTAFGSTIVGLSLAVWTMGNLRILATAIDRLARND
jgi:hypothetical protein